MLKKSQDWLDRQSWFVQILVLATIVFLVRTFGFGLYSVPSGSMETTMLVGERFFADKFTIWFSPIKRGEIISFNAPQGKQAPFFDYSGNSVLNWWQRYVWGPSNWTKRVIGIPGDRVQGKIEDGHPVVYLNGEKLNEPYLNQYPLIPGFTDHAMLFSYDPAKTLAEQPFYAHAAKESQLIKNNIDLSAFKPGTARACDIFDVTLGKNEYWLMGDNRLGSDDSRSWGPLDGTMIHGRIKFCIFSLDSVGGWWAADLIKHPIGFWTELMRWNRCFKFVC